MILSFLVLASFREDAGAFAVLPQQMKEELKQAFGEKKEDQAAQSPQAPAPDLQAMLAAAKKAQEDMEKKLREEDERKAREKEAHAQRLKLIAAGSAVAALVLAVALKRIL